MAGEWAQEVAAADNPIIAGSLRSFCIAQIIYYKSEGKKI
jgi:hypothetical protein